MKVLYTHNNLDVKTRSLAIALNAFFSKSKEDEITCVPLLQGSVRFFVDVSKHFQFQTVVDFAGASSYEGEVQKELKVYKMPDPQNIEGKTVLLFDDILDTGRTIDFFINRFCEMGAKQVIPVILLRRSDTKYKWDSRVTQSYVGYDIGDEWVYGYGMDGEGGLYRNLNEIVYNEKG